MKSWQKIAVVTLIALAALGVRVFFIWRERNAPAVQKPQPQERQLTADEMVIPRKLFIDDLKSAKALDGKTVWVQAGYELEYFPYAAHRVNFAKSQGMLPGMQALEIKDMVPEAVPAKIEDRIPKGDKQIFAVFTMPGDKKEYATAIGYEQGTDSKYYADDIFYYDDPHTMYKHWPADVWQTVDQHQAKVGMNELQTAAALGVIQQSDSSNVGNRTVHYDAGGKKWSVTFQNDKATSVKQE
ncbi:hypothetical protein [Acidipila rosea]|uniref:Uncharacterized protein n=1 Tax=Acidipila rosea TaxID=768535 RepID=A0A4R1L202_9BACT|nr:hypothetical protein [Acidipila rosea]TCK71924.1 hypothetical protein C7378_2546 [Acidipila rosea]